MSADDEMRVIRVRCFSEEQGPIPIFPEVDSDQGRDEQADHGEKQDQATALSFRARRNRIGLHVGSDDISFGRLGLLKRWDDWRWAVRKSGRPIGVIRDFRIEPIEMLLNELSLTAKLGYFIRGHGRGGTGHKKTQPHIRLRLKVKTNFSFRALRRCASICRR